MAEEDVEKEFEDVRKRQKRNFLKNIPVWQFVMVVGIFVLVFIVMKDSITDKRQLLFLGIVIAVLIYFFSMKAESVRLISEQTAKKIAVETLESKKEEHQIDNSADITPTNFCRLQNRMGEPFEWHVGIKVESASGKIDYWRVDIHPYQGLVTGIVRTPLGFEGHEMPDIVVVFPEHYMEKGKS